MRVISQNRLYDIDYESYSFCIKRGNIIYAFNNNVEYKLAEYSTKEKAEKVLLNLSKIYKNYFVTDGEYMRLTDDVICEIDKPFKQISVTEKETKVYYLPKDNEIE